MRGYAAGLPPNLKDDHERHDHYRRRAVVPRPHAGPDEAVQGRPVGDVRGLLADRRHSRTPAFIHLDHYTESRIALGGEHGGKKQVDYTASLVLLYQYLIPSDLDGADKDVWVDGLNELLDAVVDRMRSDRAFGCGSTGPVFEAANQDQGIQISRDLPHWDRGKVRCWVRVEFKITEIVDA